MTLLTIVTVTKADAEGLKRTLASAAVFGAAATVEHIVVDGDGSAESAAADGGCLWMRQTGAGIAAAFNEGLQAAKGEWVWFLNGGDRVDARLTPEFLLTLLRSSQADVIIGGMMYEEEAEPRPHLSPNMQWPPFKAWIPHPSTVVRRRLFERFGMFDATYSIVMDYEWWLRALSADVPVDVLSVPFAVFARGGISQQIEFRKKLVREQGDVIRRYQLRLWRAWILSGWRLLRVWLAAIFVRRIGKPRVPAAEP